MMYCGDAAAACDLSFGKFSENWGSGLAADESLVLDDEKEDLVMGSGATNEKKMGGASLESKSRAALKSHSEAERRRRERINAHLATLRDLVPHDEKMDKATLLAEVINQVKHLKTSATQACKDTHIPLDSDEVKVDIVEDEGTLLMKASLCCDYRHDLMSHIRKAVHELGLMVLKCEVSTLGGRVKSVLLFRDQCDNAESWEAMKVSVRSAFNGILNSISASAEFDQQLLYTQKRRRFSSMDSSCLSS